MKPLSAKQLRKKAKGERTSCVVCGRHKEIAERHHVLSLKKSALLLNSGLIERVKTPILSLCPNCHAYLHLLMKHQTHKVITSVERPIYDKLLTILNESNALFSKYTDEIIDQQNETVPIRHAAL